VIATVFDTETTGLIENPARKLDSQPEIIALAIQDVDLETGAMINHYYNLFRPIKLISQEITKITGITNEQVENKESIQHHLPYIIRRFCGTRLLIGQNIRFDMDMIELECRRYSWPPFTWPSAMDLIQNTIHLRGYRLSLKNLHIELFGEEFKGAHDAWIDCTITCKCAIELYRRGML
jgi:DNA polymerase III alpha subunit (gram-positive type)